MQKQNSSLGLSLCAWPEECLMLVVSSVPHNTRGPTTTSLVLSRLYLLISISCSIGTRRARTHKMAHGWLAWQVGSVRCSRDFDADRRNATLQYASAHAIAVAAAASPPYQCNEGAEARWWAGALEVTSALQLPSHVLRHLKGCGSHQAGGLWLCCWLVHPCMNKPCKQAPVGL